MKYIVKNKNSIGYHRLLDLKRDNGSYENVKNDKSKKDFIRDEVLESLLNEQNYSCAYCMQKINIANATIEHIIGQNYIDEDGNELGKDNQIDYDNMLVVCDGKSCNNEEHCDKSRSKYQKNRPLFTNPLENRIVQNIKYSANGFVYYKKYQDIQSIEKLNKNNQLDEDSNIKYDIQKVLNLNCQNLKEKRKAKIQAMKKLTNNYTSMEKMKKLLDKIQDNNDEFSQVLVYFLNNKLRKVS
ncbi:MAG: hypothetical protein U9N59_07205 [Campylobacterota bacterium]|nr:hypothetical protein [Campylobacterota bacterium]